ncbi:HAD-like domain-containing protein [Scheffersomyces coipomensis]|uniref:HAD-like domain-containing protein n=1 Tax=Scheffersomyces coipomensis TaxID=1788519 RepID=UPI00315DF243
MLRPLSTLKRLPTERWFPDLIITDWDETATLEDTIKLVASVPYINKPDFQPKFSYFTEIYLDSYKKYSTQFQHEIGHRDSLEKEIKFQTGMKMVELSSINAITDHNLFKDLTKQQFQDQAKNVKLKPGFIEFVKNSQQTNIPIVILSINWTSILIKQTLDNAGIDTNNGITFMVNEFEFKSNKFGQEVTTGKWNPQPSIRTAIDKLQITEHLLETNQNIMYVGDSSTDLLSLLEANTGIVIEGSSLSDSMQKYIFIKDRLYVGNWDELNKLISFK